MKILVVDDTRIYTGGGHLDTIVHVEHSWDAIKEIREGSQFGFPFHEIYLDYDLHGDDKGSNVARFVRDNKDRIDYRKTQFFIHSFNTGGRQSMQMILRDAGIYAEMIDLKEFEEKPRVSWVNG